MKNRLIVLFALMLKFNLSVAQKDSVAYKKFDRFYISLTGGISIPVGSFENNDYDPSEAQSNLWPESHNMAGSPSPVL
jgi:hypothetical protein